MDELLRAPRAGGKVFPPPPAAAAPSRQGTWEKITDAANRFFAAAEATLGRMRRQGARAFHQTASARAGRPVLGPLPFLAVTALLGTAAVVSTVYSPAFAVSVDGVQVGTVTAPAVFERVVERVESRASAVLGREYEIDSEVRYVPALIPKDTVSPISNLETYLFDRIDEVMKSYVLTVDGTFIGAAADQEVLGHLLDELSAPYITEDTVDVSFLADVDIVWQYTAADVLQDPQEMKALLTQNVNGQTVYEVAKGDTFGAIAKASSMTMAELQALNPDININKLSIGQLLTVKETIPYLSVCTVDDVVYTEPIECPVKEVEDPSMYQGDSKVLEAGVPGEALVEASVTYVNGKEQERTIHCSTTLCEASTKVVAVGTKARPTWHPNGYFVWPCSGRISSRFGYRSIFGSYSFHSGLDIATSYGSSIRASDGGTVTFSGWKGSYGKLVIVNHGNGFQTYYGHCSSLLVGVGDKVYQGQTIAKVGSTGRSTGNHCHFEIKVNGTSVNPLSYLP